MILDEQKLVDGTKLSQGLQTLDETKKQRKRN